LFFFVRHVGQTTYRLFGFSISDVGTTVVKARSLSKVMHPSLYLGGARRAGLDRDHEALSGSCLASSIFFALHVFRLTRTQTFDSFS
jgi:hypothetical protein